MKKKILLGLCIACGAIALTTVGVFAYMFVKSPDDQAERALENYYNQLSNRHYEELYELISERSQVFINKEDFHTKYKSIYEGIEAQNITVTAKQTYALIKKPDSLVILDEKDLLNDSIMQKTSKVVEYTLQMDTAAGIITYDSYAVLSPNTEEEYKIEWAPRLIFPGLTHEDKVRVNTYSAKRGNIYDRNGSMLAGEGTASSVGLVPGKMTQEKVRDIIRIAKILDMSQEDIQARLGASYVREDTFVPLKTVAKEQQELKESLLLIPGIMIVDQTVRSYPLGPKTSHLIGYVQSISAEELEELTNQGYHMNSVIGKVGLEKLCEDRLRARDGLEIVILDQTGNIKETLAKKEKTNGEDITLTIDAETQEKLYNQFAPDKSCAIAMNPQTGEVLALVSTPTYDANDFILGMSTSQWANLNEDKNIPLFNRFKAAFCPGSTFKAVTAAIGLDTGKVLPEEDLGHSGLIWKKDDSWGAYSIVTTKEYSGPANTANALKYSDNIYFAKVALRIGSEDFAKQLRNLGFEETLAFDFGLTPSTFSSTQTFATEIQLADSGYGQGQILINPLHLASIYTAFVNQGNMVKPYIIQQSAPTVAYWKKNALKPETAEIIRKDLIQVVESGTATDAKIKGLTLAGKTGTAEIKDSTDDLNGTELGWFVLLKAEERAENPLLVMAMVEDVKNRGGSHYVVPKVKALFE